MSISYLLATVGVDLRNACSRLFWQRSFIIVTLALASLALCCAVHAVNPPPDGGYPNANTAEGDSALAILTSGSNNTAIGFGALSANTTGNNSTATGAFALQNNQAADNTAIGSAALESNTTGGGSTAIGSAALVFNNGDNNTAVGFQALFSNTSGNNNNAFGNQALLNNTTGPFNNAFGNGALASNTTGNRNTAVGEGAMIASTTGSQNTAIGVSALRNNTTGFDNIAIGQDACNANQSANSNTGVGWSALINNTASTNTAIGALALANNITGQDNTAEGFDALANNKGGSSNIALGSKAGINLTTGGNNIDIGAPGAAAEANTIRIGKSGTQKKTFVAGIRGVTVASGVGVIVGTTGQLGTVVSSGRFKEGIKPMDKASETILALKPVTFRYNQELDPDKIPQFGLVAEEVAKVNPDLVIRDEEGRIMSVRYEAVNAMLLNEFLKEHRKVQEQQATIACLKNEFESKLAKQQKQIEALTAGLQKVTAQVEAAKSVTLVADEN